MTTVDAWTTQVWTAQIDLYSNFFQYFSTTPSAAGWIHECRTLDRGQNTKLYEDFWLHRGLTPLTSMLFNYQLYTKLTSNVTQVGWKLKDEKIYTM